MPHFLGADGMVATEPDCWSLMIEQRHAPLSSCITDGHAEAQEIVRMAFKGKPPGNGAGDISKRTEALRPAMLLTPKEAADARRMRREGRSAESIAAVMDMPLDEIEK